MAAETLLNLAPFTHVKPPTMPSGCSRFFAVPFCCWLHERLIGVGVTWFERFLGIVCQLGLFHMKMMQTHFALLHYPSYRKGYQFVV